MLKIGILGCGKIAQVRQAPPLPDTHRFSRRA